MRFGLNSDQIEIIEKTLIQPLQKYHVQFFVFGSRAKGKYHPFSDIDILYKLSPDSKLPPGLLSQIIESLEESQLPIKVDLVSDQNLAVSYREDVEKTKVSW